MAKRRSGDTPSPQDANTAKNSESSDEERTYKPALGDRNGKTVARASSRRRAGREARPKNGTGAESTENRRDDLSERQLDRLSQLDMAEKSLSSDQQTLKGLMDQLQRASQNANSTN